MKKSIALFFILVFILSACSTPTPDATPITTTETDVPMQPIITFTNDTQASFQILWVKDKNASSFEEIYEVIDLLEGDVTTVDITTNPGDSFVVMDSETGKFILEYQANTDLVQSVVIGEEVVKEGLLRDGLNTGLIQIVNLTKLPLNLFSFIETDQIEVLQSTLRMDGTTYFPTTANIQYLVRDSNGFLVDTYTSTEESDQMFYIEPDVNELEMKMLTKVEQLSTEGIIPSTDGKFLWLYDYINTNNTVINDFEGFKEVHLFSLPREGAISLQNFIFTSHFNWSTADETAPSGGCGVIFGMQENGEYLAAFLDKSGAYLNVSPSAEQINGQDGGDVQCASCGMVKPITGNEVMNFNSADQADFMFIVNGINANLYVNDKFVANYTLPEDRETNGIFDLSIYPGTDQDYGTRCEFTNNAIWEIE